MESAKLMKARLAFANVQALMMESKLKNILGMSGLNVASPGVPRSFHGHLVKMGLPKPDPAAALPLWNKVEPFTPEIRRAGLRKPGTFSSSTSLRKSASLIPALYISGGTLRSSPLKEIPMKQAVAKAMEYIVNAV